MNKLTRPTPNENVQDVIRRRSTFIEFIYGMMFCIFIRLMSGIIIQSIPTGMNLILVFSGIISLFVSIPFIPILISVVVSIYRLNIGFMLGSVFAVILIAIIKIPIYYYYDIGIKSFSSPRLRKPEKMHSVIVFIPPTQESEEAKNFLSRSNLNKVISSDSVYNVKDIYLAPADALVFRVHKYDKYRQTYDLNGFRVSFPSDFQGSILVISEVLEGHESILGQRIIGTYRIPILDIISGGIPKNHYVDFGPNINRKMFEDFAFRDSKITLSEGFREPKKRENDLLSIYRR